MLSPRCPACRAEVRFQTFENAPYARVYRCVICHVDLVFDPETHVMSVAPTEPDGYSARRPPLTRKRDAGRPRNIRSLAPGDHICAIYSSISQLAAWSADFLAEGLRRRERSWYVASGDEGAAVRGALRKIGVNVTAAEKQGLLNIASGDAAYTVQGRFDPEKTVAVFSSAIEQALVDGHSGFRAAADMSWALMLDDGGASVIAYEALLRSLFASARATGLCLYHRRRMPLRILNGALLTHPIASVTGTYQPNPFYDERARGVVRVDDACVRDNLRRLRRSRPAARPRPKLPRKPAE